MKSTRFVLSLLLLAAVAAVSRPAAAQINQVGPFNWALDRLDQRLGPLNQNYGYTTTGAGVHIYVIDSGIRADHAEFAGRLTVEADYVSGLPWGGGADCAGHGTAVAGIAAGSTYGVAKSAQIHVLRVWGCQANAAADAPRFRDALQWVLLHHIKPAVVTISYNFTSPDGVMEQRLTDLMNAGVVVVSSAGNAPGPISEHWEMTPRWCFTEYPQYCSVAPPTKDADCRDCPCDWYWDDCGGSYSTQEQTNLPAEVSGVITVGATSYVAVANQWDRRVKQTHWGVDVYAPGAKLYTAAIGSSTATQYFSNTSAAAPVVAGVVARYLQSHPTATPAQVRTWVKNNATMHTLTRAPQWDAGEVYMAPTE